MAQKPDTKTQAETTEGRRKIGYVKDRLDAKETAKQSTQDVEVIFTDFASI